MQTCVLTGPPSAALNQGEQLHSKGPAETSSGKGKANWGLGLSLLQLQAPPSWPQQGSPTSGIARTYIPVSLNEVGGGEL